MKNNNLVSSERIFDLYTIQFHAESSHLKFNIQTLCICVCGARLKLFGPCDDLSTLARINICGVIKKIFSKIKEENHERIFILTMKFPECMPTIIIVCTKQ